MNVSRLLRRAGSNHRPSGSEPDELPLLYSAPSQFRPIVAKKRAKVLLFFDMTKFFCIFLQKTFGFYVNIKDFFVFESRIGSIASSTLNVTSTRQNTLKFTKSAIHYCVCHFFVLPLQPQRRKALSP